MRPSLLIACCCLIGWGAVVAEDTVTGSSPEIPPREVPPLVVLTGTLRAAEADVLSTPQTSVWQLSLQWLIEEGSRVEAGDAIARFDPAGVESNLQTSEDELVGKLETRSSERSQAASKRMELELALKRAEIGYRKARLDADIPQDILENKDYRQRQLDLAKTRNDLDRAQRELEAHDVQTRSKAAELDLDIRALRDEIQRRKDELASMTLVAPRAGIVVHEIHPWQGRKVRIGDQLQASFPVARIPNLDTMEVEAWAGEVDASMLRDGLFVEYFLDAYPERRFDGRVVSVARAAERRVSWGRANYIRIRLGLDETDSAIMKPGMSVRCEVQTAPAVGG